MLRLSTILGLMILLVGCAESIDTIPVVEAWHEPTNTATRYHVKPGDTLYSIAWNYGLDYRQLAAVNHLSSSFKIKSGQCLRIIVVSKKTMTNYQTQEKIKNSKTSGLIPPSKPLEIIPKESKNVSTEGIGKAVFPVKTNICSGIAWSWPAQGKLIHNYCADGLNKGIDIADRRGSPVLAAASGKIVYAGNGLRGYGELLIIKHNDEFLSAYAHNQKLLVKEGQDVKGGQKIALMGKTEAKRVFLHFEIRNGGKPVDPVCYLPKN